MSEHQEQVSFFDWVKLNRRMAPNLEVRKAMELCYAVSNTEGIPPINLDWPVLNKTSFLKYYWYKLQRISFEDRRNQFFEFIPGLRIEMKFDKNQLPKENEEKKALLEKAGYKYVVCYSAAEAVRAVFEYLTFKIEDYQGVRGFLK